MSSARLGNGLKSLACSFHEGWFLFQLCPSDLLECVFDCTFICVSMCLHDIESQGGDL